MKVQIQAITQPLIDDVTAEEFTAYIARIGKVKDNPEKLLKYLIKHKHWSPFEHTYATFKICTSRAIGRELLRHRSFTFQELSQRYEEVLQFEDVELRRQDENNRQSSVEEFDPLVEDTYGLGDGMPVRASVMMDIISGIVKNFYKQLIDKGVARECARMNLPERTTTTILMTGNLRSWIHFLELRDDERAQKEAQLIAKEIKKQLLEKFPIIFNIEK
jgi:thymidylate synthase (FAD)